MVVEFLQVLTMIRKGKYYQHKFFNLKQLAASISSTMQVVRGYIKA